MFVAFCSLFVVCCFPIPPFFFPENKMQWPLVFAILVTLMMGIAWVLTHLASAFSSAEPSFESSEDTIRRIQKRDPSQRKEK